MTISTTRRTKTFTGNGVTTEFPYDFYIPDADSVEVIVYDTETEVRTELAPGQFTITGLGSASFGAVTYPVSGTALAATEQLIIERTISLTQETSLRNQGPFFPETLEQAFDRIVMMVQQLQEQIDRTVKGLDGETFAPMAGKSELAGKFLAFDDDGEPYAAEVIDTGSALFASEGDARTGTSTTVMMSPLRVFQAVNERLKYVYPEDFIGDDVDDTDGLQDFFNYLSTNGGIGLLTRWYDITDSILVNTGSEPFVVQGLGRYICGIRRASDFTPAVLRITRDDFILKSFGVDGARSSLGGGDHGVRLQGSRWICEDLHVYDYFSTGILGTNSGSVFEDCLVVNCHVDGTDEGSNGISFALYDRSGITGCFVENVNSSTPCIGLQLKGCTNSYISDSQTRNCFIGASTQNSDTGVAGSNNRIDNIIVTAPNPNATVGTTPLGVRLAAGAAISCEGVSIDGNDLDDFIAMQVGNDPAGGAYVSFRAANCQGANSYALEVGADTGYSVINVTSVLNVNAQFIRFGLGSFRNTVIIGREEGDTIFAPWTHVDDASGQVTNIVQMMHGDYTRRYVLEDDEAVHISVADADIGRLEIVCNALNGSFYGMVRLSASPLIEGTAGSDVVTSNAGTLTTGTSNGTDAKMNYFVQEDEIYIKNRMGGQRTVLVRFVGA